MIKIEGLKVSYGDYLAVDNLNLNIQKGELFAFLGPNGAGKTTTIKALTGLLNPDSGTIEICGHDMEESPLKAKSLMGYVPDVAVFYEKLTSIEFMKFIGDLYGIDKKILYDNTVELFNTMDLEPFANAQIEELSHGTRQRLAIAASLCHEPEVFVIDEPMVGLDPLHARVVKQELQKRCQNGLTVMMSTHLLNVAEELADRIGIIDGGKLIALGTLEELRMGKDAEALEEIFLKLFDKDESANLDHP
ncbi:MAG: ABC transporter ATP-binding protein [Verrucomicrobiota bacterium]|jgi:ABC-2 type transport system ATP-binding protein|nr:ABC transporter ATP-binding protein [Verrucomicrobiota bacterium]MED5260672.1 ABC transporter ATP-binding protein [Verrucomicrobiota bacterium]MED5456128.1 ABC transporter ATP-binding protein [Verrucomicrobiota bacterium]|tara:strand:- start:132 stop:875 length:744 start_codon:yes stop_codon:yes gene_type:complete